MSCSIAAYKFYNYRYHLIWCHKRGTWTRSGRRLVCSTERGSESATPDVANRGSNFPRPSRLVSAMFNSLAPQWCGLPRPTTLGWLTTAEKKTVPRKMYNTHMKKNMKDVILTIVGDWGNQRTPGETSVPFWFVSYFFWLLKYLCGSLSFLGNINHYSITLTLIS